MSARVRPVVSRPATRAAEGLPRWRWTTHELERMERLGLFGEHDRFELIGGEIVPMSPKGNFHEALRTDLSMVLSRLCPGDVKVAPEPQLNLTPETYVHPDILIFPASRKVFEVTGADALLVIEIADSSADYDLGAKAALYASHGVRDYWVIGARSRITTIHREPAQAAYRAITTVAADQPLVPLLVPALAVTLADVD